MTAILVSDDDDCGWDVGDYPEYEDSFYCDDPYCSLCNY
jgi:hypothetical protein